MFKRRKIQLDDSFSIFFPFTDTYIQHYYSYTLEDIEYFLKLALFVCPNIYLTSANIWQSNLSYNLYLKIKKLSDTITHNGLIHYATRSYFPNKYNFDEYFRERSSEHEHFLPLPNIYALLDFQLDNTRDIAKELDDIILPTKRAGLSVSFNYAKHIRSLFDSSKISMNEDMVEYLSGNLLSRLGIINNILELPLAYSDTLNLVSLANIAYYKANADSNNAYCLYPRSKYEICLEYDGRTIDLCKVFSSVGLNKEFVSGISFDSLLSSYNNGILQKLNRSVLYLLNTLDSRYHWIVKAEVYNYAKKIKEKFKRKETSSEYSIINNSSSYENILTYNLNKRIIQKMSKSENMEIKENRITINDVITEMCKRFNLDESKSIAVSIFGDYEDLPTSTKNGFIRELALKCQRQDKIIELLSQCVTYNSSFSIYPQLSYAPLNILSWRSEDTPGEFVSQTDYEKVIGSRPRFLAVSFLEKGFHLKDRILMIKGKKGIYDMRATGVLLKNDYILTNKHVLPDVESIDTAVAVFGFEDYEKGLVEEVPLSTEFYKSDKYDLSIVKLTNSPNLSFHTLKVSDPKNSINDVVSIIQHPKGLPKMICIGHNSLKYADDNIIQYLTDTLPGSSGSPVFNSNWEFLGIHSRGGNVCEPGTGRVFFRNEGVSINAIKNFIDSETTLLYEDLF